MLLQELFNEKNNKLENAYGVTLDAESTQCDYSSPPENLKEIGFIMKVDNDGLMDESLMDVVISYRLTNMDVLLEVPSELLIEEKLDPKYLLQLSMNVDFAVAILPPENGDFETYDKIILLVLNEILEKPNYDKFVYPISNFLEYLMLEQVLSPEQLVGFRPEQRYVIDNFSSKIPKEISDRFKQVMRDRLYEFYGSKENFEIVAKTMLESALEKSESFYRSHIESQMNFNQ